jgi:hypothetical protein
VFTREGGDSASGLAPEVRKSNVSPRGHNPGEANACQPTLGCSEAQVHLRKSRDHAAMQRKVRTHAFRLGEAKIVAIEPRRASRSRARRADSSSSAANCQLTPLQADEVARRRAAVPSSFPPPFPLCSLERQSTYSIGDSRCCAGLENWQGPSVLRKFESPVC